MTVDTAQQPKGGGRPGLPDDVTLGGFAGLLSSTNMQPAKLLLRLYILSFVCFVVVFLTEILPTKHCFI